MLTIKASWILLLCVTHFLVDISDSGSIYFFTASCIFFALFFLFNQRLIASLLFVSFYLLLDQKVTIS